MDLFEKVSRKEAILSLRGKLGKSRSECLAFAFLRGREYAQLERTINEDRFPVEGRNSFLHHTLAVSVYYTIAEILDLPKSRQEPHRGFLLKEVRAWINAKYAHEADEVAA